MYISKLVSITNATSNITTITDSNDTPTIGPVDVDSLLGMVQVYKGHIDVDSSVEMYVDVGVNINDVDSTDVYVSRHLE